MKGFFGGSGISTSAKLPLVASLTANMTCSTCGSTIDHLPAPNDVTDGGLRLDDNGGASVPTVPILSRILTLKLESASDLECPGASGTEHLPGAAGWLHKREALRRLHLIKS